MYESLVAGLHNMIRQLAATFDFDKDIIKTGVKNTRDDQQTTIHTLTQHTLVNTSKSHARTHTHTHTHTNTHTHARTHTYYIRYITHPLPSRIDSKWWLWT